MSGTFTPAPGGATLATQVRAQARMEALLMLRNGEQLLLAVVIPLVVLLVLAMRSGDRWLTVVTSALLALELAQGVVGWSQYLLGLNEVLVAIHMLGAGLLAAGFARVWLATWEHQSGDQPTGRLLAWASGEERSSA